MASPASDAGDFSLIVVEVDAAIIDEAAESLSEAFRLDPGVTQQVLRSAPIVFARGLTKHEIKAITPKLVDLSKMGIEWRVTARPTGKLPKLNWPVRPQFTAGNSGGAALTPAFDWQDSAFVCPRAARPSSSSGSGRCLWAARRRRSRPRRPRRRRPRRRTTSTA